MHLILARVLAILVASGIMGGRLSAQATTYPGGASGVIEPGLELAVGWKWWVSPPDKPEWGMVLPLASAPESAGGSTPTPRPETYEVRKGDALSKIARKFDLTVEQLKQFNELKDDRIVIGKILRIPSPEQVQQMKPPPPPPEALPKPASGKKKKSGKPAVAPEPAPESGGELEPDLDIVRQQVFLDREMFSPGVIDGNSGATFMKISGLYQQTHPDAADPNLLRARAEAAVPEPYTRYILRAEDFKFIKFPKPAPVPGRSSGSAGARKATKTGKPASAARVTVDDLMAADFLAYTSAWEFVAERFHCDEGFLRRLNSRLAGEPAIGAEFRVPNVIPFEIENAFAGTLQPAPDPKKPVIAAVVLLTRLEIWREGRLVAVMPVSSVRPGLRGRGAWTVLDAVARPRMATKRELLEPPKPQPAPPAGPGAPAPVSMPAIEPQLEHEQHLASGPNNPVGVIWLNLAKGGEKNPLPYGLHGTALPSRTGSMQSIGGLRLTNWDIARAVSLMPSGTALQWRAK